MPVAGSVGQSEWRGLSQSRLCSTRTMKVAVFPVSWARRLTRKWAVWGSFSAWLTVKLRSSS